MMITKMINFLKGKKTYIIALAGAALAILEIREIWVVPKEVWILLGAAGLTTLRTGLKASMQSVKDEMKNGT